MTYRSRASFSRLMIVIAALLATPGRSYASTAVTRGGADVQICTGGRVGQYPCSGVNLFARMSVGQLGGDVGVRVNDVWGWRDPESGREFAIVGRTNGTAFVEVTDPTVPVFIGSLPNGSQSSSSWRDMKTIGPYAVIVADVSATGHGMQVFDMRRLLTAANLPVVFDEDARYSGTDRAHNVVVDEESAFAYMVGASGANGCGGGLHMVDMADPLAPTFAGCFAIEGVGRAGTGYIHDAQCVVYHGPDLEHVGKQICFSANETHVSVADVTDKAAGVVIATQTYPEARDGYIHSGWLTEDHRYFLQTDELDETAGIVVGTTLRMWDMTDLDTPRIASTYTAGIAATDHNVLIRGSFAFLSNYTGGLRILDISDPENLSEVAFFDTYPGSDAAGYTGSWGVYSFVASGTVLVSNFDEGLFVLDVSASPVAVESVVDARLATLSPVWPNPFRDRTSFTVSLERPGRLRITLHDVRGRTVADIFDGVVASGQEHRFDAEPGQDLPAGLYVLRVLGPGVSASRPVTRIR